MARRLENSLDTLNGCLKNNIDFAVRCRCMWAINACRGPSGSPSQRLRRKSIGNLCRLARKGQSMLNLYKRKPCLYI